MVSMGYIMGQHKTILFVDDNRDNLDLMVRMLKRDSYNVVAARFASEALEILKTTKVDLLLLDINLPLVSGIELLKHLREQDKWKDIPAIALSANAIHSYRPMCMEAGFNSYLSKPITRTELLNNVGQLLEKSPSSKKELAYSSK